MELVEDTISHKQPDIEIPQQIQAAILSYSGPIPTAQQLREYEKTLPGAANRILTMAEQEINHRHTIESNESKSDIDSSNKEYNERKRGQFFCAYVISLFVIVGGIIIWSGKPVSGTIFSGLGLASVLSVFYSNKNTKKN